jgi:hypothetical protein
MDKNRTTEEIAHTTKTVVERPVQIYSALNGHYTAGKRSTHPTKFLSKI